MQNGEMVSPRKKMNLEEEVALLHSNSKFYINRMKRSVHLVNVRRLEETFGSLFSAISNTIIILFARLHHLYCNRLRILIYLHLKNTNTTAR